MKAILMAGGTGSRLYPLTIAVSKHLLPVFDKPMIFYPLSVLMLAGIRDILIVTTARDKSGYTFLLGDGSRYGLNLAYAVQDEPKGIAEGIIISEDFIGDDDFCLMLGDNIFWGSGLSEKLENARKSDSGATIFGYQVQDPSQFGVIEFDENRKVISLEEKPAHPKSNYAVTGLYFYDNRAVGFARNLAPSTRGELEITDLNILYLESGDLEVQLLGRGNAWLDTGTHENLLSASSFVATVEKRQGFKIACLEEISWRNGWLSTDELKKCIYTYGDNEYGQYLKSVMEEGRQ